MAAELQDDTFVTAAVQEIPVGPTTHNPGQELAPISASGLASLCSKTSNTLFFFLSCFPKTHINVHMKFDLIYQQRNVHMVQEQQGRVLGMLDSLSLSTQAALAGLEARLLALEAKADACLPGGITAYSLLVKHSV